MTLTVTFEQEVDGRWIASVEELAGVHVYGESRDAALARAQAIAFEVLADEIAHGERDPRDLMSVTFTVPQAA
jgi:predicted RNase H-like HicB family nuclease